MLDRSKLSPLLCAGLALAALALWPARASAQQVGENESPDDSADRASDPDVDSDTDSAGAGTAGVDTAGAEVEAKPSQAKLAAEMLFQEAISLRDQGQWLLACEKFAASHDLSPARGTLLNIAECHERAGYIASAWSAYKELEDLAQAADDTERLVIALRKTRELEPRLPRIAIRVAITGEVAGLEVTLNGMPVDAALMGVLMPVDAGEHVIEATAPGHEAWSQRVAIAEKETLEITVPRLTAAATSGAPGAPTMPAGAGPVDHVEAEVDTGPVVRNFNIKLNPLGLADGTGALQAEIRIAESATLSPTFAYAKAGDVSVLGVGVRLNFYRKRPALNGGLYIAPFASVAKLEMMGDEASAIALGGMAGHQWMWKNGFNIGAGGGLVYFALLDADPDFAISGVGLTLELSLGYAF